MITAEDIIDQAETAARAGLRAIGTPAGAKEAEAAIEHFGKRSRDLVTLAALGKLEGIDAQRAVRSEAEALGFTLAAITHENKRTWLTQLLQGAFQFLTSLLLPPK